MTVEITRDRVIMDRLGDWHEIFSHTAGWMFDTANVGYFDGDPSRLKRTVDTPQSVTYRVPGLVDFTARVYFLGDLADKVTVSASPDNTAWTPVTLEIAPPVVSGWEFKRTDLRPVRLPPGTQYLKIEFAHDANIFAPQLAQVRLVSVSHASAKRSSCPAGWALGPFTKADAANPVLAPRNSVFDDPMRGVGVHWEHDHVFNPAAAVRDGRVCVLYRAEDDSGEGIGHHTSRVGLASSADGLHFARRPAPVLYPANDAQKANEWPGGCEDPRLVETPDGSYVLTYTEWNRQTARLAVATSRDLMHWDKHGPAFAQALGGKYAAQWSKSGAIVTRLAGDHLVAAKINGHFWMLWGEGTVYAATSDNLTDWTPVLDAQGALLPVLRPRPGHFDSGLAESGPPAVLTKQGIVFLYNGKNGDKDGDPTLRPGAYSAGQALLDPTTPPTFSSAPTAAS